MSACEVGEYQRVAFWLARGFAAGLMRGRGGRALTPAGGQGWPAEWRLRPVGRIGDRLAGLCPRSALRENGLEPAPNCTS